MRSISIKVGMCLLLVGCAVKSDVDIISARLMEYPLAEQALFEQIPIVLSSENPSSQYSFE